MAASEEDTLETLLIKATSPLSRDDDADAITLFAKRVDREIEGAQISTRILAHKIQSPQEYEALQALVVLEYCVKHCDKSFQNEVGKFRFLNELIKVVSPKYLGEKTTQKVRNKVVQLLYVWSIGLKDQIKIRDAYQMLKQQGIVTQDPEYDDMMLIPAPAPRDDKNDLFKDDERRKRLEKLLQSKNPEDLQAANRLIKSVVMEDQSRMEKIEKRCRMVDEVMNNVKLLNEMLALFDSESTPSTDLETMKQLYDGCVKLRPGLFRLASDTDDDEQALMDILKANDDLSRVIQSYEKIALPRMSSMDRKGDGAEAQKPAEKTAAKSSLIDLAGIEVSKSANTGTNGSSLLDTTAASTNGDLFNVTTPPAVTTSDDIESLFANVTMTSSMSQPSSLMASQTSNIMFPTQQPPIMMTSQQPSMMSSQSLLSQPAAPPKPTNTVPPLLPPPSAAANNKAALSDIDLLSQNLLEKTLGRKPEEKFAPKVVVKPTLNQLSAKPVSENTPSPQPSEPIDILDQLLIPPASQPSNASNDGNDSFADFMSVPPKTVELSQTSLDTSLVTSSATTNQNTVTAAAPSNQPVPVQALTDVFVALESIKPSTLPPITVYDNNGLRVLFHFAQEFANPERTDTLVTVISIMSTRPAAVPNIILQVAVPKTMKVKLQTPSSTQLAAFNPIVPSQPITQVMVLANPNKKEVKMRFKLDYKLDDQTSISETGEITGFPQSDRWGNL